MGKLRMIIILEVLIKTLIPMNYIISSVRVKDKPHA